MKLRYKHQRFQTEAALAVANAFTGQPKATDRATISWTRELIKTSLW